MLSLVYHCREQGRRFPKDFELVAMVRSSKLEEILELTSSIDDHWSKNRKVKAIRQGVRSTSIGDIAVTPIGIFRLSNEGWEPVKIVLPNQASKV